MVRRTISDYLGEQADKPAKGQGRALVPAAPSPGLAPGPSPGGSDSSGGAPPDGSAALAAELNDLTETLDTVATLVASVSDRVDSQTDALGKLAMAAAETRQAAFAARAQADPGRLAAEVGEALDKALLPRLRELTAAVERYGRKAEDGDAALAKLRGQASDLARDLRLARERTALWRARLPGIGAAALLLLLVLLTLVPRLAVSQPVGCRLMGGEWRDWSSYEDGTSCLFEWP